MVKSQFVNFQVLLETKRVACALINKVCDLIFTRIYTSPYCI